MDIENEIEQQLKKEGVTASPKIKERMRKYVSTFVNLLVGVAAVTAKDNGKRTEIIKDDLVLDVSVGQQLECISKDGEKKYTESLG